MNNYFIEYRFHGYPKRYLRSLIHEVSKKFSVKGALRNRPVPHMTLYGPFKTKHSYSVFKTIEQVARKYTIVPFRIQGFDGKRGNVIVAKIAPSPELIDLRLELSRKLNKLVKKDDCQPWDSDGKYWFHSTIALKDINGQFDEILKFLNRKDNPSINQCLVRITILNQNRKIIREYDLIQKRWLNRREALSYRQWRRTVNQLLIIKGLPVQKISLFEQIKSMFGLSKHKDNEW